MFSSHRDKFQRFLLNELGSARSKVPTGLGKSSSSTSRPSDSPRDFRRITKWSAQRGFRSGCLTGGDLSTLYKTTRRVIIGHTQEAVCVSGLCHTICHWTTHRCGFGFGHRYCILLLNYNCMGIIQNLVSICHYQILKSVKLFNCRKITTA